MLKNMRILYYIVPWFEVSGDWMMLHRICSARLGLWMATALENVEIIDNIMLMDWSYPLEMCWSILQVVNRTPFNAKRTLEKCSLQRPDFTKLFGKSTLLNARWSKTVLHGSINQVKALNECTPPWRGQIHASKKGLSSDNGWCIFSKRNLQRLLISDKHWRSGYKDLRLRER